MRSGISRRSDRTHVERPEVFVRAATILRREPGPRDEISSELDGPCWSVVSFDKCEAGGLDYRQAAELVAILDEHGIHGLCIITDEAARRYGS